MEFPAQWHAVSANHIFLVSDTIKKSPIWTIESELALLEAPQYHTMVQEGKHYPAMVSDGQAYRFKSEMAINPGNDSVCSHLASIAQLIQVEIPLTAIK